jgi:hypothetical protein
MINAYLDGRLNQEEMHRLEKQALSDPFLWEALEGYEYTSDPGIQLSILQRQLQERIVHLQKKKKIYDFTWQRLSVAASASVLFITAGILFWMSINRPGTMAERQVEVSLIDRDSVNNEIQTYVNRPVFREKKYPGSSDQSRTSDYGIAFGSNAGSKLNNSQKEQSAEITSSGTISWNNKVRIQNQGTVTVNSTVPNSTTTIQSQPIQTQGTTTISTNVPTTTTSVQTNTTGTNSNISTNQNTNGNVNMNVNTGTNLNGNPNVGTVTTTTNPNQTNGSLNMNVGVTTNGMNVNMDPMNGQDGNINMNIGFNLNGANVNVTDPTIPSGNVNVNMNGSFPNSGNFQSTSTTSTSSSQTINGQTTHQSGSTTTQNNNGNVTVTTTGTPNMNGNLNANNNGTVRPINGNVTVTTNGNVIPSNGSVNLNTNGNAIPNNGNVTVTTNGNVIPNNGNVTVNANGNVVPNNGTVNASSNTNQNTTTFNNEVEAISNGECDITTNSNKSVICVSFLNNSKEFVDDLKTQSFEDDRIDIICKDLSKIYLTSAQVYQILETITFESSKYEVAKFLYVRTTDKQVLDKGLLPLFTFDSTKMDWREFTRIK